MTTSRPVGKDHRAVGELLPWYVNGRLSDGEREAVDAHLRACAACSLALGEERRIQRLLAADLAVEHMPAAAFKRFKERLDGIGDQHSASASEGARVRRVPHRLRWQWLMAASVAVIAVALSVVAGAFWKQSARSAAPAEYSTSSAAAVRAAEEAIRAVFAPSMTLADLSTLLAEAHLRIVAGPTEAGVYSLAATGDEPVAAALQRLRASGSVRFAESTRPEPASRPAP